MIYSIGDLHLDHTKEKPMDIFGENWVDHEKKIFDNWKNNIKEDDLILIPGDTSWALRLDQAYGDLNRIDKLPGKKVIIKGNHDYWWESLKKLNMLNLNSIFFIQNNSYFYRDVGIFGTRGWIPSDSENFTSQDERVFNRELNRLRLSLDSMESKVNKKVVMLHYPPFNTDLSPNEFVDIMKEYDVDICIYGHLHAEGHRFIVEDYMDGIEFHCVSSDYLNFVPKIIL